MPRLIFTGWSWSALSANWIRALFLHLHHISFNRISPADWYRQLCKQYRSRQDSSYTAISSGSILFAIFFFDSCSCLQQWLCLNSKMEESEIKGPMYHCIILKWTLKVPITFAADRNLFYFPKKISWHFMCRQFTWKVKTYHLWKTKKKKKKKIECCLLQILIGALRLELHQGPVVQSIVSLTSSLRVISSTVLADSIHNILIFFAEKCE